jgi:hypothetical protein
VTHAVPHAFLRRRTSPRGMIPRMFDDLPVCVAAFKARKALANDAR